MMPHRRSQPEAYRLFLELVSRYALSLDPLPQEDSTEKIIKSVDAALQLSKIYGIRVSDLGHLLALCFFSIVVGLLDCIFDDLGLVMKSADERNAAFGNADHQDMDIGSRGGYTVGKNEHRELLKKTNSIVTLEVLAKLTENRKAIVLLRLVHLNMPEKFHGLLQRLCFLEANKLTSSHSKSANQLLETLSSNIRRVFGFEYQLNKRQLIWTLIDTRPCKPISIQSAQSACWAPFDIYMESVMDGKQLLIRSVIAILAGGNMRHLIVEACIPRNLIDASAYFWPGYVSTSVILSSDLPPIQKSPWLTFMEGAPLNNALVNMLLMSPAPSLAEIEKLYHIALNGSVEKKPAAAKILCGSSLSRGWTIQEHVVHYVLKLLSPPIPSTHTGQRSHLVDYMPMLSAILFGASSVDTVHVLSLHGVIPEVAASLMPLCEVFGSLMPTPRNNSSLVLNWRRSPWR